MFFSDVVPYSTIHFTRSGQKRHRQELKHAMYSRRLLHSVLWVCAICLSSVAMGVSIVLLTGGSVPLLLGDSSATSAISTGAVNPQPVLQSAPLRDGNVLRPTSESSTSLGAQPSAPTTPSPLPSQAPASTSTPISTATPTALARDPGISVTSSPVVQPTPTATSAPPLEEVDTVIVDAFDTPTGTLPVRTQATWSASYVDGRYQLQINGQPVTSVSTAFSGEMYRLNVDITTTHGEAGIVFLADEQAAFYWLVIRPDGTYAIQKMSRTNTTNLVDWTEAPPLQHGAGALNRLRVERVHGSVRFFANDANDPFAELSLPSGNITNHYGFLVSSPTGRALATFDNLRVVHLAIP